MSFVLSNTVNPPTAFLLRRSQLQGRLDVQYNFALLTTHVSSKYPLWKIRDISSSRTGGTPSKLKQEYWQGNLAWASPKDFTSFHLADTEDHISKEAVSASATSVVPPGTLLIVFRSGILQHSLPVTITTKETAINQDLKALIFRQDVSAEYVGAFFVVFGKRLLPLITKSGATVQSINTQQFEQLEIPLPPKSVQGAIVTKLLSALKSKQEKERHAEQLLTEIDHLLLTDLGITHKPKLSNTIESRIFRTKFRQVTGDRWDPLFHHSDIFYFLGQGKYKTPRLRDLTLRLQTGFAAGRGEQSDQESGIVQIRPTNISDDRELVFERNIYIDPIETTKRPLDVLQRREVLFNNTNSQEQVGKTVYFDLPDDYFCSNHITRIATNAELLDPQFLGYVLNLYQRHGIFFKLCTNWNNQSGIGVDLLENIPIPLPDLTRQEKVVLNLEGVRNDAGRLRKEAANEWEDIKRAIEAMIVGEEVRA